VAGVKAPHNHCRGIIRRST